MHDGGLELQGGRSGLSMSQIRSDLFKGVQGRLPSSEDGKMVIWIEGFQPEGCPQLQLQPCKLDMANLPSHPIKEEMGDKLSEAIGQFNGAIRSYWPQGRFRGWAIPSCGIATLIFILFVVSSIHEIVHHNKVKPRDGEYCHMSDYTECEGKKTTLDYLVDVEGCERMAVATSKNYYAWSDSLKQCELYDHCNNKKSYDSSIWKAYGPCAEGWTNVAQDVALVADSELFDETYVKLQETFPKDSVCINTCQYSGDGTCDDGGADSDFTLCNLGTDCDDCGSRTVEEFLHDGRGLNHYKYNSCPDTSMEDCLTTYDQREKFASPCCLVNPEHSDNTCEPRTFILDEGLESYANCNTENSNQFTALHSGFVSKILVEHRYGYIDCSDDAEGTMFECSDTCLYSENGVCEDGLATDSTCYDYLMQPIEGCNCHVSCQSCAAGIFSSSGNWPTGYDKCLTCADGTPPLGGVCSPSGDESDIWCDVGTDCTDCGTRSHPEESDRGTNSYNYHYKSCPDVNAEKCLESYDARGEFSSPCCVMDADYGNEHECEAKAFIEQEGLENYSQCPGNEVGTKWGCSGDAKDLGLFITTADQEIVFPLDASSPWYNLEGYDTDSDSIIISDVNLDVTAGQVFYVYYGEEIFCELDGGSHCENILQHSGRSYFNVEFHYDLEEIDGEMVVGADDDEVINGHIEGDRKAFDALFAICAFFIGVCGVVIFGTLQLFTMNANKVDKQIRVLCSQLNNEHVEQYRFELFSWDNWLLRYRNYKAIIVLKLGSDIKQDNEDIEVEVQESVQDDPEYDVEENPSG